jgi:sulfate adenylyltransferase subunit 1 (EC 2.7.7.4)
MSHQSDLISTDIDAYLAQHERKELLRFLTCGNVDDGKSTLIGRLLHDSKMIYEDQLAAVQADSVKSGTTGAGKIDLALLVDGLQAEREQGITIDVAYRIFPPPRVNSLLPTPGTRAVHPQHGDRRFNLRFGDYPDRRPLRRTNPDQTAQLYRVITGHSSHHRRRQ